MKRVLLCGVNARFSHSGLALLCLKHASGGGADITEFSINDRLSRIVRGIVFEKPDAVAFSCYIWNIETVIKAASAVKKILPGCLIIMGGPEVSYGGDKLIEEHPFIDMVVRGQGEVPFKHFMQRFENDESISDTPSAWIRTREKIISNPQAPEYDINDTPFMYSDMSAFKNRTIYYETSRGCPFGCAYCMSAGEGMSYLSTSRVKEELEYFFKKDAGLVKLVDRTFNYPPERSQKILSSIISLAGKYPHASVCFHLEITAHLLSEKTIELIGRAKKGLLHLEVGIQSTNPEALRASGRNVDMEKLLVNTAKLCALDNIKVHADLIAGLPLEGYLSFGRSFDNAYNLKPDELQLGFLKLLKGTRLREEAGKYGIVYVDYPPYEVLKTDCITYDELCRLHEIERALNLLYNSGNCLRALEEIIPAFTSPFNFYQAFAGYLGRKGYYSRPQKRRAVFVCLLCFALEGGYDARRVRDALALDWLNCEGPYGWPKGLEPQITGEQKTRIRAFFGSSEKIKEYLPHYAKLTAKAACKKCFVYFPESLPPDTAVLFDYGKRPGEQGFRQEINL